jgi:tetratricopeptide (TPR) repeat protein
LSGSSFVRWVGIGVAALAIVAGAVYLLERGMAPPREQAAEPTAATTPKTPPVADEQAPPTALQNDQLTSLVAQARRLAADGKFDEAEAALQKADAVYRGWPDTGQARNEIAQMRTPEGQLKTQLERARFAIEHDDRAMAEKALAEAERLNAQAPQIAELRQALKEAEQKDVQRGNRVTELLTRMREDIARGDFAAADGDLNAAERIDVQDPAIHEARRELARAREAKQKEQQKN